MSAGASESDKADEFGGVLSEKNEINTLLVLVCSLPNSLRVISQTTNSFGT